MSIQNDIQSFTARKAVLDAAIGSSDSKLIPLINTFINNLGTYIRSGGISSSTSNMNPNYINTSNSWNSVTDILSQYQDLTSSMASSLKNYVNPDSSTTISSQITTKTARLNSLQDELTKLKKDLDVANSRQDSLSTANTSQSYVQGFSGMVGFTRPIKPVTVALLIGLGFFVFFVCGLILKDFFTTSAEVASQYFDMNELLSYTTSTSFRAVLTGIIVTFLVYAILLYFYFKYTG
jgi:hypothetical protein